MKFITKKTTINFLGASRRKAAIGLSIALVLISLISLTTRGLDLGIDFTGGVLLEVGYPEDANLPKIRSLLVNDGFKDVQVQSFGSEKDVLLRLPPQSEGNPNDIRDRLRNILATDEPDVDLRRVEFVGPQVGKDLTEQGGLAMIFALLMIFAFVMFRFQWKFAAGAVCALGHDVIITVGFFSLFGFEFDLTVVAAVLAVIGYSLNDTIVAFDRIRENFIKLRGVASDEAMNISINEMLARTIITGVTTLVVLIALLLLGGESVRPFSIALIVGIIIGTYSSIYTAGAVALMLDVNTKDLLPAEKNPDLIDDLP